jgi:hypothetical protein
MSAFPSLVFGIIKPFPSCDSGLHQIDFRAAVGAFVHGYNFSLFHRLFLFFKAPIPRRL